MGFCVLHKFDIADKLKGTIYSLGVTNIRDDSFIVALF